MGWVYVLKNTDKRLDGLYKIGHTTKANPEERAREITNGTGVIGKFKVEGLYQVYQSEAIERYVHRLLARKRYQNDREFFEATLEEIDAAIREAVANTNDQLGPGTRAVVTEEKRLEEEKRRAIAARKKADEQAKIRRATEEEAQRKKEEELAEWAKQQAVEAERKRQSEAFWEKHHRWDRRENSLWTLSLLSIFGGVFLQDSVDSSVKGGLVIAFFVFAALAYIAGLLKP